MALLGNLKGSAQAFIEPEFYNEVATWSASSASYIDEETKAKEEWQALSDTHHKHIKEHIDHPHIVKMFHFFDEPKRFMIVQELCSFGDLQKLTT